MLNKKTVLITGGTGSFGKKFIETILEKYPSVKKIIIYSRDELKQSIIQQKYPAYDYPQLRFFIGDVRDRERLTTACEGVDVIIHAAALKQVDTAEYNPTECIRTNIDGAENVISSALSCGVKDVIALSTDKACAPINLYGATKLTSDKLFAAANNIRGSKDIRFSNVRYGNVMGSRGSVIPFFLEKRKDGILPITHKEMTRFNISLQDAVDLVLFAIGNHLGGEIFVPKIPSVKIVDLAKSMAPELPHNIVGIRPGEKLHEIMCPSDDSHLTVEYSDHYVISPAIQFFGRDNEFTQNGLNEEGVKVAQGFEYHSGKNNHFLSVEELIVMADQC